MAFIIQQLDNVVNILDDSKPAGEQILYALSINSVAKPQIKGGSYDDTIQFWDTEGRPTGSVYFNAALELFDFGGAATPIGAMTRDALLDKLNNEYFVLNVSTVPPVGGATSANQVLQIAEETAIKTAVESINTRDTLGTAGGHSLVAASGTVVTLQLANVNRKSVEINNNGTGILYVFKGAAAAANKYTYKLLQDDYAIIDDYSGIVTGLWVGVNGNAQVTETT